MEGGDPELFNYISTVEMSYEDQIEKLEEKIVKLSEHPDPLIKLYLRLAKTMPDMDAVIASKRLYSEGNIKRMVDMFRQMTSRQKSKETNDNNIFIPTVTLELF